jgi:hypothetical protein
LFIDHVLLLSISENEKEFAPLSRGIVRVPNLLPGLANKTKPSVVNKMKERLHLYSSGSIETRLDATPPFPYNPSKKKASLSIASTIPPT